MQGKPPFLLFTASALVLAVLFYLWQILRPAEPTSSAWLERWQAPLLHPVLDEQLSLGALRAQLSGAQLWLKPDYDGADLLLRGELEGWQVEGELAQSAEQRASLLAASGLLPDAAEQLQSTQILDDLATGKIEALNLRPQSGLSAATLVGSLGEARLRLQLADGEAWIYPPQGLSAHLRDGQVQMLRVVPKRLLK